ncbi:radical SAM family heme chaperone HemW [Candidatus Igneacidithiobacillus taiwanensis]|uniref:radical SAM family heme chaperone HemW n=1 Tax=Candidatus Igneacidithiobacillus taiwanensis TaxID=1945924 RepID=UPI00289749C9|nr:radical SAM family heme chaperone HemW [Candidatus Igneacidithiobacillus taiwanensis]
MPELSVAPLSLYVHLPWCKAKCPYCDFNSYAAENFPAERYVDALILDLERELPRIWGRQIHSIFFGGGTPSLFPPESLDRLLSAIRARLRLAPQVEISLEANPGAVDAAAFAGFRAAGINRLSLGVQSFNDDALRVLGRIHDARTAHQAIEALQRAGFDNWNLDLIFALPGQDYAAALDDLRNALIHRPPHLSLYQLTLEPGTPFASRPPAALPDADSSAEMEEGLRAELAAAGLARYEVSAHARSGRQCWHNRNYWLFGDYLGIGAGAHGKITLPGQGILRTRKPPRPETYMAAAMAAAAVLGEQQWVGPAERPFEFFLNALRLMEGFSEEIFEERTGISFLLVEGRLRRAAQRGLLERQGRHWRPTAIGINWTNSLCREFLPEKEAPQSRPMASAS